MIHRPSSFTATMKLELTCPSGLRSRIASGPGKLPADGSAVAGGAHSPAVSGGCGTVAAGAKRGKGKFMAAAESKVKRCAIGRSGAPDNSKPPAKAASDPKDVGITARGGPGGAP